MIKLLIRLGALSFFVLCGIILVLNHVASGFSDRFYHKFTYKAHSMITGSSRALFALDPETIDSLWPVEQPFLNFAFTQRTSPFGEVYYDAICSKIIEECTTGIFIVEVTPLSVYSDGDYRSEEELILSKIYTFNSKPNYNYLFANSQRPFYHFFFHNNVDSIERPHVSGWNAYVSTPDQATVTEQGEIQVNTLKNLFSRTQGLDYRYYWMTRTVEKLSQHGQVILLRLPVAPEIRKLEEQYYPEFDSLILAVKDRYKVNYLNMSSTTGCSYYDYQHMTAESARRFSRVLGDTLQGITVRSGLQQSADCDRSVTILQQHAF